MTLLMSLYSPSLLHLVNSVLKETLSSRGIGYSSMAHFVGSPTHALTYGNFIYPRKYLYNLIFISFVRSDACFIKVQQFAQNIASLDTFKHLHNLSLSFHLQRQTGGVLKALERGSAGIR